MLTVVLSHLYLPIFQASRRLCIVRPGKDSPEKMVGRCAVNKSACFLTVSLALLTVLLFNSLTYSDSTNFENNLGDMDVSYGIVIDAGSTGSRLFLYSWTSPSTDELISVSAVNDHNGSPVVKKVTPGLSTFGEKPEAASAYIKPLLDFAAQFIPEPKLGATPVFIFATAGMRLLPFEKQQILMEHLRNELPQMTKLQILDQHIRVISGRWEGIYSWIAINYMLGRFNLSKSVDKSKSESLEERSQTVLSVEKKERPKTAGMIDMGGASAQIAYELPLGHSDAATGGQENVQLLNLGCRDDDSRFRFRLFVTTFLGFGVNEGAKAYEKLLWKRLNNKRQAANSTETDNGKGGTKVPTVVDGCLPVNMLKLSHAEENYDQFVRKGNGDWDSCVSDIVSLLFESNSKCSPAKECFFNGVHAPPQLSLSDVELYGFSEYWFSVDDVLSLGGKYEHDKFEQKAKEFCGQPWAVIKRKVKAHFYQKADSERLETQCFKSAWIHAVLHNGFHVDEIQHHFQSAFRINGQEVQWALGAIIYQMRYFPLFAESKGSQPKQKSRIRPLLSADPSVFYFLCVLSLAALLIRILWKSKQRQISVAKRRDNGKFVKYWRLDDELSNSP
ncbi:hypothetical protein niasHS_002479 [Heterodera schachtii]|uniref:Uncharacterized protein n=1 Tax=Heterodera schachtii TaxID=97005 RepID=A0ABD2KK32_HETSC